MRSRRTSRSGRRAARVDARLTCVTKRTLARIVSKSVLWGRSYVSDQPGETQHSGSWRKDSPVPLAGPGQLAGNRARRRGHTAARGVRVPAPCGSLRSPLLRRHPHSATLPLQTTQQDDK